MPNFYVYGDIHNKVDDAQKFLDHAKPEKVIWLGDFTDNFGDTPKIMAKTGRWLRETMEKRPQDIFILSNHDMAYQFSTQEKYQKWGFTPDKCRAFHSEFPRKYWERFVISHEEDWNGYKLVFSHAGWMPKFFPFDTYSKAQVELLSKMAIANGNSPKYSPIFDHPHGPVWVRWPALQFLDNVCQIVGHTPQEKYALKISPSGKKWNLCLDCTHTYYAVFKEKHAYAVNRKTGVNHLLQLPHERQERHS